MTIKLTPEQEVIVEQVRQEWIKVGASTDPVDQGKAISLVEAAYAQIGEQPPRVIFAASPREAVRIRARYLEADARLGGWQKGYTPERLHALAATITDDEAKALRYGWADNVLGGNTWAGWHGWTDAMRRIGIPDIEWVDAVNALAREIHLWWPYEMVCIVSDKPCAIRTDDRNRLHGEGVPAVEYRDGWGMWIHHDIDATEAIITGNFGRAEFLGERNAELRRVMAEVKGWEWVLTELGGQQLETDEYGTKWLVDLDPDEEAAPGRPMKDEDDWRDEVDQVALLVDVLNSTPEPDGTIKRYLLSVDPNACRALSPADCIGWTFSLAPGEYAPSVMS